jgi:P63C domain
MFKQSQQQKQIEEQIEGPLVEKAQHRAKHGSPGKPMDLGGILIDCYCLEFGEALITERGMHEALGTSKGGAEKLKRQGNQRLNHGARLARLAIKLATFANGSEVLTMGPDSRIRELEAEFKPVTFVLPQGGVVAHGHRARLLARLCTWALKALAKGKLTVRYRRLAERAAILAEAFSEVGIVALVREHTGYVPPLGLVAAADIRVSELTNNVHRLGLDEFYKEVHRVWGWEWRGSNHSTPFMGKLVMDLIYRRLPHGVLDRMEAVNPKNEDGKRKNLMYRNLTEDVGIPEVRRLIDKATRCLRSADERAQAIRIMDNVLPRTEELLLLNPQPARD